MDRHLIPAMKDPKHIVAEAYDQIAERYLEWRALQPRDVELRQWLKLLHDRVPRGASVLDIGCGAGIPLTRELSESFDVTGVDIAARQIELARRNVPTARFVHGDVTALGFAAESFHAVVASYSLFHVPRAEHQEVFRLIAGWLRPGGIMLANFGIGNHEVDYSEDWLGAPLFWSSFDADGEITAIASAGLEPQLTAIETIVEDGRLHPFLLVLAKKTRVPPLLSSDLV
jgi:ubiquinone/menaquinone biosynthesis C-methylase UbiE